MLQRTFRKWFIAGARTRDPRLTMRPANLTFTIAESRVAAVLGCSTRSGEIRHRAQSAHPRCALAFRAQAGRSEARFFSRRSSTIRIWLRIPAFFLPLASEMANQDGFVRFVRGDLRIDNANWESEALGLFELHRDTVMIGGRICNSGGVITEAGRVFGFAGVCGCPDRGRPSADPGYFTQMLKQHSVSAVSTQLAIVNGKFLLALLHNIPQQASLAFLGAWAGAHALRTGRRVVYSPFLSGISDLDWETLVTGSEQSLFAGMNRDIIPDRRFYSRYLSLDDAFALGTPALAADAVSS